MRKILLSLLSLVALALPARAQINTPSVTYILFAGAPSGSCATNAVAENIATGDFYDCVSGAWFKVNGTGGGGGGPTLETNGTSNASQTVLNFITSGTNASGLTVTPANATSTEVFEITGKINAAGFPTLTGDVSNSGLGITVTGINGVALPTVSGVTGYLYDSAGTLSFSTSAGNLTSGTLPAGRLTADAISTALNCPVASGSSTAYVCVTAAGITPVDGKFYDVQFDVASGVAPTLSVNGTVGTLKKLGGGTNLTTNDIIIGMDCPVQYDGANYQLWCPTANAPTNGTVTSVQVAGDGTVLSSTPCTAITTSGTCSLTLVNAAQNSVLAGPATGGAGAPTYQTAPTISAANMTSFPTFNQNTTGTAANVTGTVAIANGGTTATTAANARINLFPTASEVGDLVYCATYSSGCTSWALLAGNTSGTQYLQETSAGAPSWTTPSGGAQKASIVTSAYTNATQSASNVTGLSFSIAANATNVITCQIVYQTSLATGGPNLIWTGPASPTAVAATMFIDGSGTAAIVRGAAAHGTTFASTALSPTYGSFVTATDFALVTTLTVQNGSNAGTVQLQALASAASTTITFQVGSSCVMN